MAADKSSLVVFVHGMFMTPLCWGALGVALSLARPAHTGSGLARARVFHRRAAGAHPVPSSVRSRLSSLCSTTAASFWRKTRSRFGRAPRWAAGPASAFGGIGAGRVAIDSAPPQGVISPGGPFLKSNWPAINPFAREAEPISLSFEQFQYAFVNGLPPDEQKAAYSRYAVPESRRVGKGPTTAAAAIDFARPRPLLLFIAGSQDHIIPASLNRTNHAKYRASGSVTDFNEFAGRTHFIIGQRGWEEVADYALDWLVRQPTA